MQRLLFNPFAPAMLALAILMPGMARAGTPPAANTFTNPIAARGADPWVVRWNGRYYYCYSSYGGIYVNVATNLEEIAKGERHRVWHPPGGTHYSRELWAPELHRLQGKWYIYFAADDGQNPDHRMYVLEGDSDDPAGPFIFKGKIAAPSDRWAIDGTVLEMPDGKLYFIWSGWKGTENIAQDLYLAPMSNPWTISGERVCISRPEFDWEKHGLLVNEGPETLWHGNRVFVIYSASGTWTDYYCLGQLAWNGGDPLDPKSWVKSPRPVFQSSPDLFAPGHCSFVKSPDGAEDWIVYHTHIAKGTSQRDVHIQRFTWNADGSPNFGVPVSDGVPLARPSGEN